MIFNYFHLSSWKFLAKKLQHKTDQKITKKLAEIKIFLNMRIRQRKAMAGKLLHALQGAVILRRPPATSVLQHAAVIKKILVNYRMKQNFTSNLCHYQCFVVFILLIDRCNFDSEL